MDDANGGRVTFERWDLKTYLRGERPSGVLVRDAKNPRPDCLAEGSHVDQLVGLAGHNLKTGLAGCLEALWQVSGGLPIGTSAPLAEANAGPRALAGRLTPEQIAAAAAAYEGGASAREVAALLGISKSGAIDLLRQHGVHIRVRPSLSDADVAAAAELYSSGLLLREVGERLGVSRDCVRLALKARGVRLRPALGGRGPRHR